ncbi:hypothetical protein [Actinacidiphila glaucinigra]|uniref:hypothetical protein n=1 Tax=Actinacidiphila glaucinigra TaxID=235986 RepID=UPI00366C10FE
MNEATVVLAAVSIVTGKVSLLIGLWLRLRWRTRHEHVQRQVLTSVAESIPEGGQVEVLDRRPDGHCLRIKIIRATKGKNSA